MADETPTPEEQQQAPAEAAEAQAAPETTASGPSLLSRLKVIGFVVVVVVVECLVAYLYLPDPTQTAAMAGSSMATPIEEPEMPAEDEESQEQKPEEVEVDLDSFTVTSYQAATNTTLRIDFHLFATVAAEDQEEFLAWLEANRHRFRDQVIVTMRAAEITDLTDAGLGLIKRKILDKTNRAIGKPLVRSVIFSDFSFIEQ